MSENPGLTRRRFLQTTMGTAIGVAASQFPMVVPHSVFGQGAPSRKIQVGQIGCGRIAREMDLPGILKHDIARVVAVCDLDSRRLADGKKFVEEYYQRKTDGGSGLSPKTFSDYRELLDKGAVDAVAISTPDHWHAELIIVAALAGKDVYVQKPLSMTLTEGRAVSDILRKKKTAFQIGSQQRSDSPWPQFRHACELVRNGRIGRLQRVEIGLPTDPAGLEEPEMPVPGNLDYDRWLGCTPKVPYTEKRVHPQTNYERPGWLRIESYCLGMITGWGSHHLDIAHWGMGSETTGPLEIEARAEFPKSGIWNVHGSYHIEAKYANGVLVVIDNNFPNGVRFHGDGGWVFVSRGDARVTASDPAANGARPFAASDEKILKSEIGSNEIHLYRSPDHHLDWLQSIQTRKPAATNPEQAHRSTSACILGWIAMRLGRTLRWDPEKEKFIEDETANSMLSRPERAPYGIGPLLKRA